jgi:cellulose synthase/poly-beta-1,6-N-acetylglucosamine synthase-like glycosyltransferase
MIVSIISIGIIIIYLLLISALAFGFDKIKPFNLQDLPAKTKFSVIIPFRNEAENLNQLLASISKLNYPKSMFEVILVDDDSEDDSVKGIHCFISKKDSNGIAFKVIQNKRTSHSPKKDAISTAVKISKFDWIITTDADCILPKYWLDAFDEFIQLNDPNCIVAPVTYHGKTSFFNRFQTLDILSLQGATVGGFGLKSPFMCNGANFGYRKSLFESLNGFEGNTNIASGDDIFLLEKFLKHDATKVQYLKSSNAIVSTNPCQDFINLVHQRVRWASKTSRYNNVFAKLVGLFVFLGNLICLTFLPLVLFNFITLKIAMSLFVIKFCIDFLLLFKTARFFKQETLLLSYVLSSLLYPPFCVYVALLSLFKSYEWKGRTFKK